ncbi:hypothetical protein VNI00_016446 [Paramarasmius palmivorus]|uniref:Uncharacterized protein n=1 Tax=Paramarasmius palmivorus TaxID=297713 RepID=A0AAW0BDN8_9AGAR
MPNTIERTPTIRAKMTPFAYAPATLGLKIVLVTTAIITFFALSGLVLYRLRASMASRRPVDVEAAVAQAQTQTIAHLALQDTFSRLIRVHAAVEPNAGSEAMLSATPDSMSPKTIQHPESGLIASSSFEGWAASLCDLIEEFAGGERVLEPGLVVSSSFEVWAANLCDLITDFASPAPFRSGFTPLVDTFEDDPYIFDFDTSYDSMPENTANVPDIIVTAPSLPQIAEYAHYESYEPAVVSSPSFMDMAAECVEELDYDDADTTFVIDDDETEDDTPVTLADELLGRSACKKDEPVVSLSFGYSSILPTEIQTSVSGLDNEVQTNDCTAHHEHSHSQYLSPSSALSLPPVVEEPIEECEPEETLKSVFESDSEDDDTYYSRRPHLSRPKQPSPSMSSMLRAIVEKRKAQQNRRQETKNDKENEDNNYKKRSRTTTSKRRLFSKALATPSEPSKPIKVPTIRLTPPTPPRRALNREKADVGLDLGTERDEVVERVAFDLVFDDHGRCFF